jgi:hypothetical protein
MKFWELTSITREKPGALLEAALSRPEWKFVADWLADMSELSRRQDREKLDHVLPTEFVRAVLGKIDRVFYFEEPDILRSRKFPSTDLELSTLDAFNLYGGSALEDALEKGMTHVTRGAGPGEA